MSIWPISSLPLPSRPSWLLVLNLGTLTSVWWRWPWGKGPVLLHPNAEALLPTFHATIAEGHCSPYLWQVTSHGHWVSQGPGRAFHNQVQWPWKLHFCHLSLMSSVSQMAVQNYPSKGASEKTLGPMNKPLGRQMNLWLGNRPTIWFQLF